MPLLRKGSIRRKLIVLIILAVLPAFMILLYTGVEQRRSSIDDAEQDVLLVTQAMAQVQENITKSARQLLATLSLLPEVKGLNLQAINEIFTAVLQHYPEYHNIILTDPNGLVIAAGKDFGSVNLADRKHVREALGKKTFAAGEFILTRVGPQAPILPFAHPLLGADGQPKAVLTIGVDLTRFSRFYDPKSLRVESFIAVTDYRGIRLFYYPTMSDTNPIGVPIKKDSWEIAQRSNDSGSFISINSSGIKQIFAFKKVRLEKESEPYIYVWAGIAEDSIVEAANRILQRNIFLLLIATIFAISITWTVGKSILVKPINSLVTLTRKFALGKLAEQTELASRNDEFGTLAKAFHDMAGQLNEGQQALQENESRFRIVMDSIDSIVYVADMDTHEILFINEFVKKTYGNIVGKICWRALQKGNSGPCSFCNNNDLIDADGRPGEPITWEHKCVFSQRWYRRHDRAISWVDGRIVRLEIAADITENKLAEAKLAEESERLAVTLRSIGDGVIATDMTGTILLFNQIAEDLTGWQTIDAIGKPLFEVFTTAESFVTQVDVVSGPKSIKALPDQTILRDIHGDERWISINLAPIQNKRIETIGYVVVFSDISERLRTTEELLKLKKLESIGVLAGGIAHDYNNILVAILGNLELSLLSKNLESNTRKSLINAQNATMRAKDLNEQLLTFAKGGHPVKGTAYLNDVVIESAAFALHGDTVSCRYCVQEDSWPVDIDKGQISQVIQNMVLNASQAMTEGGVIDISIENTVKADGLEEKATSKGRYVKLTIEDHGHGIPEDVVERIFDPYFTTKQQGSGLGLAVTHSIIQSHNGSIGVTSEVGVGTIMTIYLPASEHVPMAIKDQEITEVISSRSSGRIMVMDDEKLVRDTALEILQYWGHSVILVEDGKSAIQQYQDSIDNDAPIDLIIMDLTIPGRMGGQKAVQHILAINPEAKVIVSSGYSDAPVMAFWQDYGFCGSIKKPYSLENLHSVVGQFIM